MLDQALLTNTLQKINASLNKRFEKDADLYISKQDEYELKKHICNNAFGAVVDMIKGKNISPEIVMKVFVRNAGIIIIKNISAFEKEMKSVLESIDYKSVRYMMEDVLSNNVYMDKKLRHVLFKYYVDGITEKQRLDYWKHSEYEFDAVERNILFYSIMKKTKHSDPKKQLQFLLDYIKDAFEKHPIILQYSDVYLTLKEISPESDKEKLFLFLCQEMENPSNDDELYSHIVQDAYISYGKKAFEDAVSKIKDRSPKSYKQYIMVIAALLKKEKDINTASKMFDTVVRIYESPYIKSHVARRINEKVWKAAKANEKLYAVRTQKIDQLCSKTEQKDSNRYVTFNDVVNDMMNGNTIEKSIGYFWINMNSKAFEQSLVESFNNTPRGYEDAMEEIYRWMFWNSARKKTLQKTCESFAAAILQHGSITGLVIKADDLLLENVIKYSFKGEKIKTYLATYHFDEYQSKYIN